MPVPLKIEISDNVLTARAHKQVMRKLYRQAGTRIRFEYFPKHFENRSETRPGGAYGYEKRSKKYQIGKARRKGHQRPLVYSGRMKQAILANTKITSTPTRGTVKARNYFPMKVERRQEIEAISAAEANELAKRMERDYTRYANSSEFSQFRRKRRAKRS